MKKIFLLFTVLLSVLIGSAQTYDNAPQKNFLGSVSFGSANKLVINPPSVSVMFGDSATPKAIILPRVQTTAAILFPVEGMYVYSISDSSTYVRRKSSWVNILAKVNLSDTASMLNPYRHWTQGYLKAVDIAGKLNISDTGSMLNNYQHWTQGYLKKSNNLSDLNNIVTARTNLGLGTLATQSGTFSGTSSGTNTGDQDLSGKVNNSDTGSMLNNYHHWAQGYLKAADITGKLDKNSNITGATKTKITYDLKGLVTSGADATTADIAASTNKNYVTDAQVTLLGNTSGTNTGDQTLPTDATIVTSDITTNNASSSKHGWLPKLSGVGTDILHGDGSWSAGGGGGEINTASNLGGGLANWDSKSVFDLRFNTFNTNYFDLASNLISLDTINGAISGYNHVGFLSKADWITFNNKISANQTITLSGDIGGSGSTAITTTIGAGRVVNSMLANMVTASFKGRVTAGTGVPEDMTGTQATTLLDVFTTSLKGLVPASSGGTVNFLRADGTFAAPPGGGETNTASNLGGGLANFDSKVGVDLRFNTFEANNFDLVSNKIILDTLNGPISAYNHIGYLPKADWTIFNNKQPAGNYITGLTGDVTASGPGSVSTTIAAGAVTLADMANVATSTVFYRKTAATGVPEVQTLATLKTDLLLTGTNSGDQTITLTGNVTGSGSGSFATTIAAGVVTLAMQANVATGTVFYRKTAATGVPEVQTLATLKTDLGLTGTNSGDQTITLTGNVTGTGTGSFATTIGTNVVTNSMLAQMATHTFKGNNTGSTANALDLTATQLTAELNQFTTSLQGVVPSSGGGTTNFLRADGTWAIPAGSVTSVSVVNANGFNGSVATATSTPAITISTTVTGLLKGNGTAISAATSGGDYAPPTTTALGLTAAGSTQGTALVLSGSNSFQEVTTAASGTGVQLPVATATSAITIVNRGVNAIIIYPATSGVINGQSANLGFTLPAKSSQEFVGKNATDWYTLNAFQNGDVNTTDASGVLTIGATKVTNAMLAGSIDLTTKVTGILPAADFPVLAGDVTTPSGSLTTTIANSAVSYAKMQNASATNVILGRKTSGSGVFEEITVAGDIAQSGSTFTIGNNIVTNAKSAQMTAHTFKGNNTAGTANAIDLTQTQLTAELNQFTTSLQGVAPSSGGGTINYLRADGTWASPPGIGTVTSVSVVSANGFGGSVATATSTPAITLTTSITGILKGNGTSISAAGSGTDYSSPVTTALGLTAAGTTQGTALVLSGNNSFQEVTTAASGTGVQLPVSTATSAITIVNRGANAIIVYPATSGTINGQSANTGYTLLAKTVNEFVGKNTTDWYVLNAFQGGDVGTTDASSSLVIGTSKVLTTNILDANVTYAKIQNLSATNVLLGRKTAGAGVTEEITVGGDLSQSGSTFTIGTNVVTNAKSAQMAAHTYKGNNTASTANALDLTQTQLTAELNAFTTSLQGVVPASGGGTTNFLRADGTWTTTPGGSTYTSSKSILKTTLDFTFVNDAINQAGMKVYAQVNGTNNWTTMSKINLTSVAAGDILKYQPSDTSWVNTQFSKNYLAGSQIITSGTATTVTTGNVIVYVNPASVLATHTITTDPTPADKQLLKIYFGGTVTSGNAVVTTLAIAANTGQTLFQSLTPIQANGGDVLVYEYDLTNTRWIRIK